MIVSKAEFARFVGYSPRQVTRWLAAGMPAEGSGKKGAPVRIDSGKAVAWLLQHAGNKGSSEQTPLTRERERLVAAQARRAEIEAQRLAGELVPAADVQIAFNEAMRIIATNEDAIPGRLAQKLSNTTDPGKIRQLLLTELRRGRNTAADRLAAFADD